MNAFLSYVLNSILVCVEVFALFQLGCCFFKSAAQKWKQWRKGGIDADMVCLLAKEYETKLRDSGAIARENARWPQETSFDDSLERMETWIRRRFQYLDGYFGL